MKYLINEESPVSVEDLKLSLSSRYPAAFFLCTCKDSFSGRRLKIEVLDVSGDNVICQVDSVHSGDEEYPLPDENEKYLNPDAINVDRRYIFPSLKRKY